MERKESLGFSQSFKVGIDLWHHVCHQVKAIDKALQCSSAMSSEGRPRIAVCWNPPPAEGI